VVFVTGHAKPGDPGTDWEALACCAHQARLTLVIYMGVSSATRIQEGLLQGLPADTPVAIIQHASLPQQRHALGKLDTLVQTLQAHDLGSPSVIVVGDVLKGLVATQNPSLAEAATEWRSAA
jgi:uroporphyrin-III C-methyltransferase